MPTPLATEPTLSPERRAYIERQIASGYTISPRDARLLLGALQAAEAISAEADRIFDSVAHSPFDNADEHAAA